MTIETVELDIRGQVCPSCLLLALREVNIRHAALHAGQVQVAVLTDNRHATGTIPETVRDMGLFAKVDKLDGYYRVVISKSEGAS